MTDMERIRDEVERDLLAWASRPLSSSRVTCINPEDEVVTHVSLSAVVDRDGVRYQRCGGGYRRLSSRRRD